MQMKVIVRAFCLGVVIMAGAQQGKIWAQTAPHKVEITAKRFSFEPKEITVKKGEPVLLVIKSQDVAHGLRFRELNAEVNVRAGGTGQVEFTPDKTGDFVGHCSVFCGSGHGSMAFTLHVVN